MDLDLAMAEPPNRRFVVGYAFLPKKQQSFIRPSLLNTARDRGIDLVPIDPSRPLAEQGHFDCVIHKLQTIGWTMQLSIFASKNSGVPIVDHPFAVDQLHNRITMLQFASVVDVPDGLETVEVPKQVLVHSLNSDACRGITRLRFPIIAKPLISDGSPESHKMIIFLSSASMIGNIKPPVVLQEFINHGGVIFKVYVAGNRLQCVRRKSLPDIPPQMEMNPTIPTHIPFSRVSNTPWYGRAEAAELPPSNFVEKIATGLRFTTGLRLFNFDMIRDANDRNRYYIVDINYFPGYSKMPGYEKFMTDFFWDMVHQRGGESPARSSSTFLV